MKAGERHVPIWVYILAWAVLLQITFLVVSVYMHRGITHRAIAFHPAFSFLCRAWLWFWLGQVVRSWVGTHRIHHQYTDEEGDPHSPKIFGFWAIFLANEYYYDKTASNQKLIEQYTPDISHDPLDRFLDNMWLGRIVGVLAVIVTCFLLSGWWGLLIGPIFYIAHMYSYMRAGGIINGLCHTLGYRNFRDNSATNVTIFGWLLAGEGFHNNHHHDQSSPKLSYKIWELDPGWLFIKLLILCRLAELKRQPAVT